MLTSRITTVRVNIVSSFFLSLDLNLVDFVFNLPYSKE